MRTILPVARPSKIKVAARARLAPVSHGSTERSRTRRFLPVLPRHQPLFDIELILVSYPAPSEAHVLGHQTECPSAGQVCHLLRHHPGSPRKAVSDRRYQSRQVRCRVVRLVIANPMTLHLGRLADYSGIIEGPYPILLHLSFCRQEMWLDACAARSQFLNQRYPALCQPLLISIANASFDVILDKGSGFCQFSNLPVDPPALLGAGEC